MTQKTYPGVEMPTLKKKIVQATCRVAMTWAFAGAIAAAAQTPLDPAEGQAPYSGEVAFRINAQPIEGALREFATQANLQLIYETTEVRPDIQSSHVAGALTPEAALSR